MLRFSEQIGYDGREMPPARLHAGQMLRWLWPVARLPVLLPLVILEPIVAFLLGGLALLGLLTTAFFALIGAPHFPTGTMLMLSISFALALVLYEGAIRILAS
jgi:hypothetical protein